MPNDREQFSPSELAVVLSHYDLGVIASAKDFPRGSRKSPKLVLRTADDRQFMLKRRAAGRDDPYKVAFAHALLNHLRQRRFPVPALVGTRAEQNSMLQLDGATYELFEFVRGERYDASLEQTTHAGKTLARFHRAVQDFETEWVPPHGSYHDSPVVRQGLNSIPSTTASHDSVSGHEAELLSLTQDLYERYDEAAEAVNAAGCREWSQAIIHGDWHPGNMLFHRKRVVAVLDLDAARRQPPILDVANGMLQFSILRGRSAPSEWPDFFDETRMRRFLLGYQSQVALPAAQRGAIPHLMIESLVAECVFPIAATGSFGWLPGFGVLQMVARKVRWLTDAVERLRAWMTD
ncbi:MAG: phosphotransferase [Phycisphaerae bacterium]|jgi:homoserine kinase type II